MRRNVSLLILIVICWALAGVPVHSAEDNIEDDSVIEIAKPLTPFQPLQQHQSISESKSPEWVCGDIDCSNGYDISDLIFTLNYVNGGPTPCSPVELIDMDNYLLTTIHDYMFFLEIDQFTSPNCFPSLSSLTDVAVPSSSMYLELDYKHFPANTSSITVVCYLHTPFAVENATLPFKVRVGDSVVVPSSITQVVSQVNYSYVRTWRHTINGTVGVVLGTYRYIDQIIPAGKTAVAQFTIDLDPVSYDRPMTMEWSSQEPVSSLHYYQYPWVEATNGSIIMPALYDPTMSEPCIGIRGNIDYDPAQELNIADIVYLVDFMFNPLGGLAPLSFDETDVDGSGEIDVADLVYLVEYSFSGGPAPGVCP